MMVMVNSWLDDCPRKRMPKIISTISIQEDNAAIIANQESFASR